MEDIFSRDALDMDVIALLSDDDASMQGSENLTYHAAGVLASLTSPHFIYDPNTTVNFSNPVRVVSAEGWDLGFANLFIEGHEIRAELSLNPESDEVNALKNNGALWLHAHGAMDLSGFAGDMTSLDFYGGPRYVEYIVISSLVLSDTRPSDPRIARVK